MYCELSLEEMEELPYDEMEDFLLDTVRYGDVKLDLIKRLVNLSSSIDIQSDFGWSLLHTAAAGNFVELTKFLISAGVDLNIRDVYGNTPLHLAAKFIESVDVLCVLLEAGADIEARDYLGWTPLYEAAYHGHLSQIDFLLKYGANPNVVSDENIDIPYREYIMKRLSDMDLK